MGVEEFHTDIGWLATSEPDPRPPTVGGIQDFPEPAPRCKVCTALVEERADAFAESDWKTVVSCNNELRNHPHAGRRVQ